MHPLTHHTSTLAWALSFLPVIFLEISPSSTNFIQFSLRWHVSRMVYSICVVLDWWQAQQAKSVYRVVSLQFCLNKSITYCQTSLDMFWLTTGLYGFIVREFCGCFPWYFWNPHPQLRASKRSVRKILMSSTIFILFLITWGFDLDIFCPVMNLNIWLY